MGGRCGSESEGEGWEGDVVVRERGDVVVKVRVRVRGRCCSEGEG